MDSTGSTTGTCQPLIELGNCIDANKFSFTGNEGVEGRRTGKGMKGQLLLSYRFYFKYEKSGILSFVKKGIS